MLDLPASEVLFGDLLPEIMIRLTTPSSAKSNRRSLYLSLCSSSPNPAMRTLIPSGRDESVVSWPIFPDMAKDLDHSMAIHEPECGLTWRSKNVELVNPAII